MNKLDFVKELFISNTLTPAKVVNFLGSVSDYFFRRKKPLCCPSFVSIEPTNLCNLRCDSCPVGSGALKGPYGRMDIELYKKIIEDIKDTTLMLSIFGHGEPFIHKDLVAFLKIAKAKKVFTRVSTNGHFFRDRAFVREVLKSGVNVLIISVDGANQKNYEEYRKGGHLNTVLEGLKFLAEEREKLGSRSPFIEIQTIAMNHNIDDMDDLKKLVDKFGFDKHQLIKYQAHPNRVSEKAQYTDLVKKYVPSSVPKMNLYKKSNHQYTCVRPWFSTVINWDGSISLCTFDSNRDYFVGNLSKKDFHSDWHGESYANIRERVCSKDLEICKNCVVNNRHKAIN